MKVNQYHVLRDLTWSEYMPKSQHLIELEAILEFGIVELQWVDTGHNTTPYRSVVGPIVIPDLQDVLTGFCMIELHSSNRHFVCIEHSNRGTDVRIQYRDRADIRIPAPSTVAEQAEPGC
ncbi:MAG: hypothetical protein H8D55_00030 [Deltaproteobacteria bacterium]|nr:hypothetical protein [Deltaproteobacteria bacterium]